MDQTPGTPSTPGTPPAPEPAPAAPAAGGSVALTKDDKTMALAAHLLGILGFIGPLIIWIIKKDQSAFVADQSKESLNFQITVMIVYVVCIATSFLIVPACIAALLWVAVVVLCIMGGMKANEGEQYRYPFALRLIK